jgi:hypothetical protein
MEDPQNMTTQSHKGSPQQSPVPATTYNADLWDNYQTEPDPVKLAEAIRRAKAEAEELTVSPEYP